MLGCSRLGADVHKQLNGQERKSVHPLMRVSNVTRDERAGDSP